MRSPISGPRRISAHSECSIHVLGTCLSLSLYLLARIPPSERERFHGRVFWFGKRRIRLPYHQYLMHFFRAMKTAATTPHLCLCSFDLLIAIQSTTEYLGIIVFVQLQIYLPTYLLPSLRKNCPPNPPSSSHLSSPRLASSSSTTIPFFFFTHKKIINKKQ